MNHAPTAALNSISEAKVKKGKVLFISKTLENLRYKTKGI